MILDWAARTDSHLLHRLQALEPAQSHTREAAQCMCSWSFQPQGETCAMCNTRLLLLPPLPSTLLLLLCICACVCMCVQYVYRVYDVCNMCVSVYVCACPGATVCAPRSTCAWATFSREHATLWPPRACGRCCAHGKPAQPRPPVHLPSLLRSWATALADTCSGRSGPLTMTANCARQRDDPTAQRACGLRVGRDSQRAARPRMLKKVPPVPGRCFCAGRGVWRCSCVRQGLREVPSACAGANPGTGLSAGAWG